KETIVAARPDDEASLPRRMELLTAKTRIGWRLSPVERKVMIDPGNGPPAAVANAGYQTREKRVVRRLPLGETGHRRGSDRHNQQTPQPGVSRGSTSTFKH